MQLTTKARYGTRAVLEIAKAYGTGSLKRREIASDQSIPDSYLENILVTLKAAGLIRTARGANGGYRLARRPQEITLLEVVTALEGHITPVPCLETGACTLIDECMIRTVWSQMYQAMETVLAGYTLQDIIDKGAEQLPFAYSI